MCNVSHFIFYVCGNSAVLDDCIVHQAHTGTFPRRRQNKTACHTRVRVVSIQQTHGTAVPWVEQTKSPSCCAHTRLNWHVGSVHMWNVLFQAPVAQSVEIYTMLMEYCWTILSRCKFGNTPFNTRTNDHGQRWCVSNFLLAFFKPSKSYFRSRTMSWPCFRPSSPF